MVYSEFLYLETKALRFEKNISSHSLIYFQNIFKRFDNKHIKRVTKSQKKNVIKGDFCQLVKRNKEIKEESNGE